MQSLRSGVQSVVSRLGCIWRHWRLANTPAAGLHCLSEGDKGMRRLSTHCHQWVMKAQAPDASAPQSCNTRHAIW